MNRKVCIKRIGEGFFRITKLINMPIDCEVSGAYLDIDADLTMREIRILEVELSKMQCDLEVVCQ